jgi:hypothetical protein
MEPKMFHNGTLQVKKNNKKIYKILKISKLK